MQVHKNIREENPAFSASLIIKALRGEAVERPPFWFMRQAGRYLPEYREMRKRHADFLSMCYSPAAAAEVTLQPVKRFDTDAAILFSDILVVPDALGAMVEFVEGKGPALSPLRTAEDLAALSLKNLRAHLSPVYEAVEMIRKELPQDKSLIGFAGAPWTVACYMVEGGGGRDFLETRSLAYGRPEWFSGLISLLTEAAVEHLLHQIKAGADVVQLFDSWAGLLPEEEYRKWVILPAKDIVRKIKHRYPGVPVIGFPKGSGALYEAYATETGVDGVGVDAQVPLEWARDSLQKLVSLQGNLDPVLLAADGERAMKQAAELFDCWKGRPFVFNLGHGMLPHTPPEHVAMLSGLVAAMRF